MAHPTTIVTCLTTVLNNLQTQAEPLEIQIEETIATGRAMLTDLQECQLEVILKAESKIKAVYEEIIECSKPSDLSFNEGDNLWEKIKEFIQKAKEIVDEFTNELTELFQKIKEKIEEIASIETVEESIKIIIEDLNEMLSNAGLEINTECLEGQKDNIKKIAEDTHQAAMDCINNAEGI